MEEENEFQKVKFNTEFNPYKGTLKLNLLEILDELNEEAKKSILSDGGWWNLISHQMAEDIVNEFSRECYNPEYTKLRQLILNSEAMPEVIRQWAVSMIESRERAKDAEQYWSNAYHKLHNWIRYESKSVPMPILNDRNYGKKYSDGFMQEIEEKIAEWKSEFPELKIDIDYDNIEGNRVIDEIIEHLDKLGD
jgi:hypothetical protein